MKLSVAGQIASTFEVAAALIFKPSGIGRSNYGQIEIDQMTVVHGIALHGTYPVGVMTCRTRRFLIHDM